MAKWNKSETLLLLTLYEQYPFLYKTSDRDYMNKSLKRQKLYEIWEELQKVKEDVSIEDIKIKIKTLRSQLRKEKRIIQDSKRDPLKEEYVPTLWSYRHIRFLDDELDDEPPNVSEAEAIETITTETISCDELDHVEDSSGESLQNAPEVPPKRMKMDNFKEEAKNAFEFAKSYAEEILQNRVKRKPETKEDIFTKYLAEQLKLIQSEDNYEDTTWKILQVVREGVRKDRTERKEVERLNDSTGNRSTTVANEKRKSGPRIFPRQNDSQY